MYVTPVATITTKKLCDRNLSRSKLISLLDDEEKLSLTNDDENSNVCVTNRDKDGDVIDKVNLISLNEICNTVQK